MQNETIRRSAVRIFLSIGALAIGIAACSTVPTSEIEDVIDAPGITHPHVVGLRGPLSEGQSRAILDRLRRQSADSDVLQRHIALEQALSDSPLVVGNKVRLLRDGPETFGAMFAAMDRAAVAGAGVFHLRGCRARRQAPRRSARRQSGPRGPCQHPL